MIDREGAHEDWIRWAKTKDCLLFGGFIDTRATSQTLPRKVFQSHHLASNREPAPHHKRHHGHDDPTDYQSRYPRQRTLNIFQ